MWQWRGVAGEEEREEEAAGRQPRGLGVVTGGRRGHWKSRWTTLRQLSRHGAPTATRGDWVTGRSSLGWGVGAPTLPGCELGAGLMEGRRFHGVEGCGQWEQSRKRGSRQGCEPLGAPGGGGDAEWGPDTEEQREEGALAMGPQAHRGGQPWAAPGSPPGSLPVRPVRAARMSPRSQGRRTRAARGA